MRPRGLFGGLRGVLAHGPCLASGQDATRPRSGPSPQASNTGGASASSLMFSYTYSDAQNGVKTVDNSVRLVGFGMGDSGILDGKIMWMGSRRVPRRVKGLALGQIPVIRRPLSLKAVLRANHPASGVGRASLGGFMRCRGRRKSAQ